MMEALKVGIIGTGFISQVHLEGYAQNPAARVVAVCDLDESLAARRATQFGVERVYKTYQELLADPEIDAVNVLTWNDSHAEISIAALEAGKHVLVEKPLCKTVAEAERVAEAVKRTGKQLQVGYVRRHSQNAKAIKRFVDGGDIGDIYYAKATCLRRAGNPGKWFSNIELSGGGPLIDLGVHIIDLCWYLMGKPRVKTVSGNTYNRLGNRAGVLTSFSYGSTAPNTVEDLANAVIRFENGASLLVETSFTLHAEKEEEVALRLYGDKGGAEIEPRAIVMGERYGTIVNLLPQLAYPSFNFTEAFNAEIDHFVDVCLGRAENCCPIEDGVEMIRILRAIYDSAAQQREIQL